MATVRQWVTYSSRKHLRTSRGEALRHPAEHAGLAESLGTIDMPIRLKRAYESPEPGDGERYLVERLWPRGVKKDDLSLTAWLKDIAPSTELRKWYGHQPERHSEFARRYEVELTGRARQHLLQELVQKAEAGNVTLVFSTKETDLSGAAVLKGVLDGMAQS